jgi:cation/acetate symporter
MITGNPMPQLGLGSSERWPAYRAGEARPVLQDLGFAYLHRRQQVDHRHVLHHHGADGRHRRPAARDRALLHRAPVRDARVSAGWALVFIAMLYTTAPAVGAMAPNLTDTCIRAEVGAAGQPAGDERPQWCRTGKRPA